MKSFTMKKILKPTIIILKGFVLGVSMALPGLSGGTMAFIMGIYEKLIEEISKLQRKHLNSLLLCLSFKRKQIKQSLVLFGETWDWAFLIPLILGIVFSIVIFVAFAPVFIEQYSLQFYSIVFGLVLASVFKPFKKMLKTARIFFLLFLSFVTNVVLFAFGANLSLFPGDLFPLIFIPVGFVVSAALIVPGLSGSYLLLIFGLYEKTLLALKQGELLVICCFLIGSITGILSTAKLIQYLIKNYFNETIAIILGLILGSLYAVYPLPKESLEVLLPFGIKEKIFLFYFISSFCAFLVLSLLYEKNSKPK